MPKNCERQGFLLPINEILKMKVLEIELIKFLIRKINNQVLNQNIIEKWNEKLL